MHRILSIGVAVFCLSLGFQLVSCSEDGNEATFSCVMGACTCEGTGIRCLDDNEAIVCKDSFVSRIHCSSPCQSGKGCQGESYTDEKDNGERME